MKEIRFERNNEDRVTEEEVVLIYTIERQGATMTGLLAAEAACLALMTLSHGNYVAFGINMVCALVVAGVAIKRGVFARKMRKMLERLRSEL